MVCFCRAVRKEICQINNLISSRGDPALHPKWFCQEKGERAQVWMEWRQPAQDNQLCQANEWKQSWIQLPRAKETIQGRVVVKNIFIWILRRTLKSAALATDSEAWTSWEYFLWKTFYGILDIYTGVTGKAAKHKKKVFKLNFGPFCCLFLH